MMKTRIAVVTLNLIGVSKCQTSVYDSALDIPFYAINPSTGSALPSFLTTASSSWMADLPTDFSVSSLIPAAHRRDIASA